MTALRCLLPRGNADSDVGCFVAAVWLDAWAVGEASPGPVDNGPLLCMHQRLNPNLVPGSYRVISTAAWEALVVRCQAMRVGRKDSNCAHTRACVYV